MQSLCSLKKFIKFPSQTKSPGEEEVQSKVVAVGSVKLYAFNRPSISFFFLFIVHFIKINQLIFGHFKLKKGKIKNNFFHKHLFF